MDNIPCVPIISDAEANASEKHTCIRSWQLVSLSPEHYPLLALQPAGGADLRQAPPPSPYKKCNWQLAAGEES